MKIIITCALLLVIGLTSTAQNKNTKTESFIVLGNCEQCKHRIEKTLADFGTVTTNWEISTNLLTVSYDSLILSKEQIQKRIASLGHDSKEFKAPYEVYKNLPKCCKYDRLQFEEKDQKASLNKSEIKNITNATITGVVLEEDSKGKLYPLSNATVQCLHSNLIVSTDSLGVFHINCSFPLSLAISYVGFKSDTINIITANTVKVILKNSSTTQLKEVVIRSKNPSTYVSSLSTFNTLNLSLKELTKAACCNLSESFETTPTVDVSYADAVTGVKQIQLLGLSGQYTQILTENLPEIRGLAGSYGLNFIPGPCIESIQLTKGVGSVVNGYESIAGQINVEEKKPDKQEKLFVNAYANNLGRLETTANLSSRINKNWSSALMLHANGVQKKLDNNNDGFLDIPTGRQYNFMNRWKYADANGLFSQITIKYLTDQREAGELLYNKSNDYLTTNRYGVGIDVEKFEIAGKIGYLFPQHKYKSVGLMFSNIWYNNQSYYGLTQFTGKQNSLYANLIYQSIIGNTDHKFRTGFSFVKDNFQEIIQSKLYQRTEIVPGAFFEYTYSANKFTAIAGIRQDYHNQYNIITTPRLHLKYDFDVKTNLRFSVGSGFRVANIFTENVGLFVSSRAYNILNPTNQYGYGLAPEKAWNYGLNFIHNFRNPEHPGSVSIDFYHTNFANQTIVDVDAHPQKINFYNLDGKSFSNSIQVEVNYELFKKFDVRLAYRYLDVQTTYHQLLLERPMIAKHRAFINLAFETSTQWKFDLTTQWTGKKRLPSTVMNPTTQQMDTYSPSFIQINAQVTKQFGKVWDIYIGAENLTGFMQQNLIIDASSPFSQYFDASMVWGPMNGRIIYLGLRYKLN